MSSRQYCVLVTILASVSVAGCFPSRRSLEEGLILACSRGDAVRVRQALQSGLDPNLAFGRAGALPLVVAAHGGHLEVVDLLLKSGADVNSQDRTGATALLRAIPDATGTHGIVDRLLQENPDVNLTDSTGQNALMRAARFRDAILTARLAKLTRNVDQQDHQGRTVLWLAVERDAMACVKILLDSGADPGIQDRFGVSPVRLAETLKRDEMLPALRESRRGKGQGNRSGGLGLREKGDR